MNKIIKKIFIISLLLFLLTNTSFAVKINWSNTSDSLFLRNGVVEKNIKTSEVFYFFSRFFENKTPDTYKYINLNFKWIKANSNLEKSLQILIYNDKIDNLSLYLDGNKTMNAYSFYKLSNLILETDISNINKDYLLSRNTSSNDLNLVKKTYQLLKQKIEDDKKSTIEKNWLFNNVYETIINNHYDKKNIKEWDLVYWAIEWLAKWTWDKHTIFFPPTKNKIFKQSLTWDYEWIWAYVELKEPWKFVIISPIPGSPAEKAGLRWWDRVIKVWDNEITKNNSSEEIISWIKWEAWTIVNMTILRWWKEIEFNVKREKIHIWNIDYELVSNWVYNIKIKNFWSKAAKEFSDIIKKINSEIWIDKIIIDLRNNWGWYLDEVTKMLSYIIPKWEPTAVIKYLWDEKVYKSLWLNYLDLNKYKVVILQNSGTASASEIMIWTLKDYFPEIITIWEKSYGKGSVQTIKSYSDWSSFKYTIAKWFTWKSQTGIDGLGIEPDINIELDQEELNNKWIDNQLEKALEQ